MTHRLRRLSTVLGSTVLLGAALAFGAAPRGGWLDRDLPGALRHRLRLQDAGQLRLRTPR